MEVESNKRNTEGRGPSRTTWPPAWPADRAGSAEGRAAAGSAVPSLTPTTLPPDLRERWEERVAIMHHDGGLSLPEAERLALADVLDNPERDRK